MSLLDLVVAQSGLTPDEVDEFCVRTDRIKNGSIHPDDWANVEVLILMAKGGPALVQEIASGGLDKFNTIARPILVGHAFRYGDFKRMYRRICAKAERG
jgi:hypothetical protein